MWLNKHIFAGNNCNKVYNKTKNYFRLLHLDFFEFPQRCLVLSSVPSIQLQTGRRILMLLSSALMVWSVWWLCSGKIAVLLSLQRQTPGLSNRIRERCGCWTIASARKGYTILNLDIQSFLIVLHCSNCAFIKSKGNIPVFSKPETFQLS